MSTPTLRRSVSKLCDDSTTSDEVVLLVLTLLLAANTAAATKLIVWDRSSHFIWNVDVATSGGSKDGDNAAVFRNANCSVLF